MSSPRFNMKRLFWRATMLRRGRKGSAGSGRPSRSAAARCSLRAAVAGSDAGENSKP